MAENTFPEDWRDQPCYLVAVPKPLVPFVGGLLRILEQRGFWATELDYANAYTATIGLEACLMASCLNDLIAVNRATYRLLDTALFGTVYSGPSVGDGEVLPAIPNYRSLAFDSYDSVLGRLARTADVVDNAINGTITPEYSYTGSVKEKLDAIIAALGEGTDLSGVISELEAIALLLG